MKWICFALLLYGISIKTIKPHKESLWRLPDVAIPLSYNLTLTFTKEFLEDPTGSNEYTGDVLITYDQTQIYNGSLYLHLDSAFINVSNALVIRDNDTLEVKHQPISDQITEFQIPSNDNQPLYLKIKYTGKPSTLDKFGLYLSTYRAENDQYNIIFATQFEPIYARRVFPCFDEPKYGTEFNMKIIMPDDSRTVLFNTARNLSNQTDQITPTIKENEVAYEFIVTPKMSTFSLGFILSHFKIDNERDFTVYTQDSLKMYKKYIEEVGSNVLDLMNNFTNLFPMDNINVIAIPDSSGPMTALGLIAASEADFLFDEQQSPKSVKENAVSIIAHQLSKIWFGNLVTTDWWSNLFLNEGFATFFEYYIRDKIFPNDQTWDQFVLETLQVSLREDSSNNTKSLNADVNTSEEINAKFDTITNRKGASLLRMLHCYLGEEGFQRGVQNYLQKGMDNNGNADPKDLWDALEEENYELFNLNSMMESYINNTGFPVVNVVESGNLFLLAQEPMVNIEGEQEATWTIPITYITTYSNVSSKMEWLIEGSTLAIPKNQDEWIMLNQSGYYRVNYDTGLWDKLASVLQSENFGGIAEINRAQIVDDLFALADTKRIQYTQVFDYIKFLENDHSYFPWKAAFTGFESILKKVGSNSELGKRLTKHILKQMETLYNSVKNDTNDDNLYTKNRMLAYSWACKLGNSDCINFAVEQYNNGSIDNDLRSTIQCTVLRNNDTIWQELLDQYKNSLLESEQLEILSILGCTSNATLLWNYMNYALSSDDVQIRKQYVPIVFKSVYGNGPIGINCAYEFLKNQTDIDSSTEKLIKDIAGYFNTEEQIEDLEIFINKTGIIADEAIQIALNNVQFIKNNEESLIEYFKKEDSETTTLEPSGATSTNYSVIFFMCFILLISFNINI